MFEVVKSTSTNISPTRLACTYSSTKQHFPLLLQVLVPVQVKTVYLLSGRWPSPVERTSSKRISVTFQPSDWLLIWSPVGKTLVNGTQGIYLKRISLIFLNKQNSNQTKKKIILTLFQQQITLFHSLKLK